VQTDLLTQIRAAGLPVPATEYPFFVRRDWRFDFAWWDYALAVEVEGGGWKHGRHHRPKGFEADCEKYNEAALLGWKVLRVTTDMVRDGRALALLERALKGESK
jgi:very-short-patch-repair endonuclease